MLGIVLCCGCCCCFLAADDDRCRWCCIAGNTAIYATRVEMAKSIESIKLTNKQKSYLNEDNVIRIYEGGFKQSPSNETM